MNGLVRTFVNYTGNPFNGIISDLTKKCGGNVHEKQMVIVTASSVNPYNTECFPYLAVDLNDDKHFYQSANEEGMRNPWLTYDFIYRKVRPTHYTIRSRPECSGNGLKTWVIEGSNTDSFSDWKILDSRINMNCLILPKSVCTFNI